MSRGRIKAFLDRYDGEFAVLLLGDEGREALWPADMLPDGVGEGSVLWIDISVDAAAQADARRQIDEFIDRLRRGQ